MKPLNILTSFKYQVQVTFMFQWQVASTLWNDMQVTGRTTETLLSVIVRATNKQMCVELVMLVCWDSCGYIPVCIVFHKKISRFKDNLKLNILLNLPILIPS